MQLEEQMDDFRENFNQLERESYDSLDEYESELLEDDQIPLNG